MKNQKIMPGKIKLLNNISVLLFILCLILPPVAKGQMSTSDVFVGGEEGYKTYRIPSIVKAQNGDLLAFCEGRISLSDHAQNDIVLKISKDNGNSWEPLVVLVDDGKNSLNNPQAVVEGETGKVILMYQRYPEGIHEREVVPGYEGQEICRNFVMFSEDHGKTWSNPEDITAQTKRPTYVTSIAGGPGIGIQLSRGKYKGRIIMPFNQGPYGNWKLYAVYSDDKGKTWQYGDIVPEASAGMGNEVQMVELADGSVMINARSYSGSKLRKWAISTDGGINWTGLKDDNNLIESECMGSVLRYSFPSENQRSVILFSNPASTSSRVKGTVRVSYDEGKTWPVARRIYEGAFAYSCLVKTEDNNIGALYERDGYSKITFSSFSLDWVKERAHSTYYYQKKTQFDMLPDTKDEIIFLGNSITDIGSWVEWFPNANVKNRGINGDRTDGILFRLNEITSSKPKKIFIMIGVNDLAAGSSPEEIIINYRQILDQIKKDSPNTEVYVQSLLPVNKNIRDFSRTADKGSLIIETNILLKTLVSDKGYQFVDLHSKFIDSEGQLNKKYTNDGLHINGEGYKLWKGIVKEMVYH